MFGLSSKERFVSAIRKGDLAVVKKLLEKTPELLNLNLKWLEYSGSPLHFAACYNKPDIVRFLVAEKKLPVDCKNHRGSTPLLHASDNGAYEAAALLLELGANPLPPMNANAQTPASSAWTPHMVELFRPIVEEDRRRKKQELEMEKQAAACTGGWTLPSSAEVVHDRLLSGADCRLTDVFNFETRRWVSITRDVGTGHVAQNDRFFDEIADKEILKIAYDKLTELGGKADPDIIEYRSLSKPDPRTGGM